MRPITEFDDIQALVRTGYGALDEAVFLLVRVNDPARARAWIGMIANRREPPRITSVADLRTRQDSALQIAFTANGLRNLGLSEDAVLGFSREFLGGMGSAEAVAEGRSRRLGDVGSNAPANWLWGAGPEEPDAVLLLYAATGGLAAFVARVKSDIAAAFTVSRELPTTLRKAGGDARLEHFGFMDGVSQPQIDWAAQRDPTAGDTMEYGNLVTAGEFLLGYANEYGLYEDRPLLAPERDPHGLLAPAADDPTRRDLARNGTYLVFRQLDQDVSGFWRFMSATAPDGGDVALAESMIGRRMGTGDALVRPGEPDMRRNGFTFDSDPDGLACPIGAHIRRANPRTADIPGGRQGLVSRLLRMIGFKHGGPREDVVSSVRFHRMLRRGRSYGAFVDRQAALASEGRAPAAGLHFIGVNASISRQFEFVQNAWLCNPSFDGLSGESDALLGNRLDFPSGHKTDAFTAPQSAGPCRRVAALPQFVTVRGGAYFFLPSLRALRFLAGDPPDLG